MKSEETVKGINHDSIQRVLTNVKFEPRIRYQDPSHFLLTCIQEEIQLVPIQMISAPKLRKESCRGYLAPEKWCGLTAAHQ